MNPAPVSKSAAGVRVLTRTTLFRRNLFYYWRTNLAVVAGVAATVAVLAGALLVGDSVRGSLRDLSRLRLGKTDLVVASENFFRESLAEDLRNQPGFAAGFSAAAPLIALEGLAIHEKSGRRAVGVAVYGVDSRFWEFHGLNTVVRSPQGREALLSSGLAREFGASPGDALLVRVQQHSDVPLDSLHGRKDEVGRSIRVSVREALPGNSLGEFSLRPQQGAVRAVFLPLARLQEDLRQPARVNTLLLSEKAGPAPVTGTTAAAMASLLRETLRIEDLGLRLRALERQRAVSIESDRVLLDDGVTSAIHMRYDDSPLQVSEIFTYLAISIRAAGREIPYSLVTAMDLPEFQDWQQAQDGPPPLLLNEWAVRDLNARPGETISLDYFIWEQGGHLRTASADFVLRGTAAPSLGEDRDLAPQFPGISESERLGDWNPPFPVELKRIRPRDEEYWKKFRTAPKALIPLAAARRLWSTRYGSRTSVRLTPRAGQGVTPALLALVEEGMGSTLNPAKSAFTVLPVSQQGEAAAEGAVSFGEYFLYFSFFLVVSAALLTGLFFKLGVEQRLREIGLLRALGFAPPAIARLFFTEGALLAVWGSMLGLAGAVGYGALMMYGLRTWWVGAVGTTLLRLHVSPLSLLAGAVAGLSAALLSTEWALRGLRAASARDLLHGEFAPAGRTLRRTRPVFLAALSAVAVAAALMTATATGALHPVAGFFGAGALLLAALLGFQWDWLVRRQPALLSGHGFGALTCFGLRNARWRPGRSLLCISLIASATFIIAAVDSFRRGGGTAQTDPHSGTGGYTLLAESVLPVPYDPNTPDGLQNLNVADTDLASLAGVKFVSFRLRPGDDASCLNLYQPRNPRLLGVPPELVHANRFSFQSSLARTPEERRNPWLLLEGDAANGAIPAILDANSMTYIFHLRIGDEFLLPAGSGPAVRFRIVAALGDSIFQSEMLISEANLLKLFPGESSTQGYRFFLADVPQQRAGAVASALEEGLEDFGLDAQLAGERLVQFHRVENTYISTFQSLGGLGLLLGTVGLAAVLLRNILERRRELALLRAVGYRPADLAWLVLAENTFLLSSGLISGVGSAMLAIAPALAERGGGPALSAATLLALVVLTGLAASLAAVAAVVRAPLLPVLRAE